MVKKTLEECVNIDSFIKYLIDCFIAANATIYEIEKTKEKINAKLDEQIALNKKNTSFKFYDEN